MGVKILVAQAPYSRVKFGENANECFDHPARPGRAACA
jgi:hypothetical protein